MAKIIEKPKIIYHYTSSFGLSAILRSGHIGITESNLNTIDGNCGVVWLTSSPEAMNHGLKFDESIPSEHDKTHIRISLLHNESFEHWDEWSDVKGMDKDYKEALICSANAQEMYQTWYVSEAVIPICDIIEVKNMVTGEIILVDDALKSISAIDTPNIEFRSEIDKYIAGQPMAIQIPLLNVRLAIKQALPDAEERISWQMPTFWKKRNIIHFAAQKKHLGIYPGVDAIQHFAPRLTEYRTSKGTVQFPYNSLGAEQIKLIAEIAVWCGTEAARE